MVKEKIVDGINYIKCSICGFFTKKNN